MQREKAIKLAISSLEYIRRQRYAAGNAAFKLGHDLDFAVKDHKYTEAIEALKAMVNEPVQIAFSVNPIKEEA